MKPRSCHLLLFSLTGLLTLFAQVLGTSGQNTTVAAEKAGTCPDTEAARTSGNCTEECQSDANCEGSRKCCPTGCGTSCRNPNDKPGSCPEFSPISGLGLCSSNCSKDSDCKQDLKCCVNGCGQWACTKPKP